MADNQNEQSSSSAAYNPLITGLVRDVNDTYITPGMWSYARNASKVTPLGDLSTLSNEQSNSLCSQAPFTITGGIHLFEDKWIIFSTDNTGNTLSPNSEIGYFEDVLCKYTQLVRDPCPDIQHRATAVKALNFSQLNLIIGAAKENFDCTWRVYWADGLNVDRYISVDVTVPKIVDSQFINKCTDPCGHVYFSNTTAPACTIQGCTTCIPTCSIDPDLIRLASLVQSPCITTSKGKSGGSLLNGSYFATIRYTVNEQPVTDFFPPSNVQSLFSHQNESGSLDISFTDLDTEHFSEFELTIVRTINLQTSAKRIGIYSTRTKDVFLDAINESLTTIPIEQIPLRSPVWEKSEAIYPVGNYLVRVAPTSKFDFNYQPLANRITCDWISVSYPKDYYKKGGNNPCLMRDEIYPFFIRFINDTGDRSSSYHIPGRPPLPGETAPDNTNNSLAPNTERHFEVVNTAFPNVIFTPYFLSDGGHVIAQGKMGYWESTEVYPDNKPDIWNSSTHPWSNISGGQDLCGLPIRHHKIPDNLTQGSVQFPDACMHIDLGADNIRLMGVKFGQIRPPVDNNGVPIPGIVAYEILRGSREGNKTVIAKGMINNMRTYNTVAHPFPQPPDGLFQNYCYNDLGFDRTLSSTETQGGFLSTINANPLPPARSDIFTFHSPDTQFKHPFLSTNELKVYSELTGTMQGAFGASPGHPQEKLLNNLSFFVAALVGVGEAVLAIRGTRVKARSIPTSLNIGFDGKFLGPTSGTQAAPGIPGTGIQSLAAGIQLGTYEGAVLGLGDQNSLINLLAAATGNDIYDTTAQGLSNPSIWANTPGVTAAEISETTTSNATTSIPSTLKFVSGVLVTSHYWTLGADTMLSLIKAVAQFRQYAYRFLSEGFYNNSVPGNIPSVFNIRRYPLDDLNYLDSSRQSFNDKALAAFYTNLTINNLYRSQAVVLQTQKPLNIPHSVTDQSYSSIGDPSVGYNTPTRTIFRPISSYYTGIIQRIKNQYGQLDSIEQINVGCKFNIDPLNPIDYSSGEIFAGDTYVSRYTEKNTFFYFWDWLYNQPDGYEFDYRTRYMLTYPTYWADFTQYEAGEFLRSIFNFNLLAFPSSKAALDRTGTPFSIPTIIAGIRFTISNAYFYLFQSGVRDFFVESEVNTDLRDYGDVPEERYYDPYSYTDLYSLFDTKIIKSANYFKYDYSLSISRLFQNFISWGNLQLRNYDPLVAASCYVTRPTRVLYSLQQHLEDRKDFWRVYLVNDYRDFYSKVSVVKPINKSGAVFLFTADSPIMFNGVDQLTTDLGTKVTLGDGELFSQPEQSVTNVDISYEYGSSQDRLSVINTPFGLYYMCANQGKIFKIGAQLDDITYHGLKFWFKEYLPFKLLTQFPTFEITSNPVAGIGCQAIYDNQIETIYFCKKDWSLKPQYIPGNPGYIPGSTFTYQGGNLFNFTQPAPPFGSVTTQVALGDSIYFDDASWTISFDPKAEKGGWISYHDWHPDLNIPSKNNFLTTKRNQLWRHNLRRDSYCNYYGTQFPFSVEYIASTQFSVNTLRSIEYYLECYKYNPGTLDRFHILDENFDHAVIYNTEQVSGSLTLIDTPKNNPFARLTYPQLVGNSWQILYDKEEQKYRVQSFWDLTRDRGEFPPFAQQMIWFTDPNGYTRTLNPANIDLNKPPFQRKKFRHYLNKVVFTKDNSADANYIVKAAVSKELQSLR